MKKSDHISPHTFLLSEEIAKEINEHRKKWFLKSELTGRPFASLIQNLLNAGHDVSDIRRVINFQVMLIETDRDEVRKSNKIKYFRPSNMFGLEHFRRALAWSQEWEEPKPPSGSPWGSGSW